MDAAALAAFRWQLQVQTGCRSAAPGFDGMLDELRQYQATHTVAEQAECSDRIMRALVGPIPFLYRLIWSSTPFGPAILAWFTQLLLPFLVGDMTLTSRAHADARAGGVLVKRCKVLDESGCAGLCLHMCKLPTERFFAESWGTPVAMAPNFETGECQLSFGVERTPLADDPSVPRGCLSGCPLSMQSQHEEACEGARDGQMLGF